VNFEQAKKLAKIGFNWEVSRYDSCYSENGILADYKGEENDFELDINNSDVNQFSAPTVSFALEWFRDVKGIKYNVFAFYNNIHSKCYYGYGIVTHHTDINDNSYYKYAITNYLTYEATESSLLDELVRYELEKLERDKHITDRDLEDKEDSYFDSESYSILKKEI